MSPLATDKIGELAAALKTIRTPRAKAAELNEVTYNGVTVSASARRPSSRDDKKFERDVMVDGKRRIVHYGQPGEQMERDNPEAREAFLSRHSCSDKKDPSAPGFWACYEWEHGDKAAEPTPETPKPTPSKSARAVLDMAPPTGEDGEIWRRTYDRVLAETGDELMARMAAIGMVNRRRSGLAIKQAGNGLTIEGWAVLFGDAELVDLERTYFNENTNYLLDLYPTAPLWYQHGEDSDYDVNPVGQRVSAKRFEGVGIWMVHKLYEDHPLIDRTLAEIEDGLLGYSTDSIGHFVIKGYREGDGYLGVWPLAGCSIVKRTKDATQAEPGLGHVVLRDSGESE